MKHLPLLVLALSVGAVSPGSAFGEPIRPFFLPNSQVRDLPPTTDGRRYQLLVGLPGNYDKEPGKRYPVVYVTDGYWDFQKITSCQGSLVWDKVVPSFITVGISYTGENLDYGDLRRWELTPIPFGDNGEASGHAADFLRTIERTIVPFIEREYRADPSHRVMAGASLGGLFTLYAMYTKPELFGGYIAVTPAVAVNDDWLLHYEEKFAAAKRPLPVRLFASVGGNESPSHLAGIIRFNRRVAARNYSGMAYQFRIVDDERHAGMQQESYSRGLRWVFAPLAPESGPSRD